MQEIPISKFKATCLSVMERVRKTRQPIRVTRFGDPVAEIVPPTPGRPTKSWLGAMAGSARIAADIVSPAGGEQDWDVFRR